MIKNQKHAAYQEAKEKEIDFEIALRKQFPLCRLGDLRYQTKLHNEETTKARIAWRNAVRFYLDL